MPALLHLNWLTSLRKYGTIHHISILEELRRELPMRWHSACQLNSQRSALLGMRHDGVISHDVFDELAAEIDATLGEDHLI